MVKGTEVVRIGWWDGMSFSGVLRNSLIALGHQLGDGLQKGTVGLNEVLDGRDQFLPFALRERDEVVGTEILCVHNTLDLNTAW